MLATAAAAQPAAGWGATCDWTATGHDCTLFAAGDVDGDGFAEVLTVNGARQLCAAPAVHGWKAAPWEVLREPVEAAEAVGIAVIAGGATSSGREVALVRPGGAEIFGGFSEWKLATARTVPAPEGVTFAAARAEGGALVGVEVSGERWQLGPDGWRKADAREPEPAATPDTVAPPPFEPEAPPLGPPFTGDVSGDGLPDALRVFTCAKPHAHRVVRVAVTPNRVLDDRDQDGLRDEDEAGLGTDPESRDTDQDGLLDGWEVHGFPRGVRGPETGSPDPLRQDVLLLVSRFEQVDEAACRAQMERVAKVYAAVPVRVPGGKDGLALRCRFDAPIPASEQHRSWGEQGNLRLGALERGIWHWLQVTPGSGGQSGMTTDMGGAGCHWAALAHELGHQLGLGHCGDSEPAWCPLYPSLMNYAFNYQLGGDGEAIRFSDGRFRGVELRETALPERLPFPPESLRYLSAHPFRFPLESDGNGGTRIDWNQDGRFDEDPVRADINYGGSTHGGIRRPMDISGSAPVLACLGDRCVMAFAAPDRAEVRYRVYQGGERWSEPAPLEDSATDADPVLAGGPAGGLLFLRAEGGWSCRRYREGAFGGKEPLAGLPPGDLSAAFLGDRVLLVSRAGEDGLEGRWLGIGESLSLSEPWPLATRSLVPPAVAWTADGRRGVLATSMPNPGGAPYCLRVTELSLDGDRLVEGELTWTHGPSIPNHCAARPAAAFDVAGTLTIFHATVPAGGLRTVWRTRRVGNAALDGGWLTCLMYDEWTLTEAAPAFADGPQGAIYAFRWDPGDHGEYRKHRILVGHNGYGLDPQPMRDFDDGALISRFGIRHSILLLRRAD